MKKFMKISLITAGILLVTGFVFGSVSAVACGGNVFRTIREEDELNDKIESFADAVGKSIYYSTGGRWGYLKWDDSSNSDLSAVAGTSYQIEADGIRNLELELGAGTFIIEEKETDDGMIDMLVSGTRIDSYNDYVKGSTLHVEGFKGWKWSDYNNAEEDNEIRIRFPKGSSLDKLDVETGASLMEISDIKVNKLDAELGAAVLSLNNMDIEKLSVEVGAGQMEASNIRTKDAEISVGVGECIYGGTIAGKLDAECSMGNMEFLLTGNETDHNYEIECGAGNVEIGGFSVSALAAEKTINNNAASKFDIECSMGNITITFDNQE